MYTQTQLTAMSLYSLLHALRVAVLVFASMPAILHADEAGEFLIKDASSRHDDSGWHLDAHSDIRLSEGARGALENGVPLVFELRVQVVKTHTWLWDTIEYEQTVVRQLQYHALSRSYLVKDKGAGTQGVYSRLEDALYALGLIDSLLLTDKALAGGREYIVRLRGSLDIESLPTPVRLLAYVSSKWVMNSQWHSWKLAQ